MHTERRVKRLGIGGDKAMARLGNSRSHRRGALAVGLILATVSAASAGTVTYDRLVSPEDGNWLTNNRTFDGNRYAPLDEINTGNVGDLRLAFAVPLKAVIPSGLGGGLQGTPLVDDGIMYMVD